MTIPDRRSLDHGTDEGLTVDTGNWYDLEETKGVWPLDKGKMFFKRPESPASGWWCGCFRSTGSSLLHVQWVEILEVMRYPKGVRWISHRVLRRILQLHVCMFHWAEMCWHQKWADSVLHVVSLRRNSNLSKARHRRVLYLGDFSRLYTDVEKIECLVVDSAWWFTIFGHIPSGNPFLKGILE